MHHVVDYVRLYEVEHHMARSPLHAYYLAFLFGRSLCRALRPFCTTVRLCLAHWREMSFPPEKLDQDRDCTVV